VVRVTRAARGAVAVLRARSAGADDERGAVLVMFAAMLTAMIAFSALVIDVANARQERRQAQNGADSAALAGAQSLPDPVAVVASVKDYVERNNDIPASAWIGCVDPQALESLPDAGNANSCISISPAFQRVRVRLPIEGVPTYFGGALGVDEIAVSASATAEALLQQDDRIIPAAVTAAAGSGNLCIETSGANTACNAMNPPTAGNFGSLRSPRLRIYDPGPTAYSQWLRINYAMGIDHTLSIYDGAAAVCDGDVASPCTATNVDTSRVANHLNTETGNEVPPLTEGLVQGFTESTDDMGDVHFCGRFTRPDLTEDNVADPDPDGCTNPGTPTIDVLGTTINGRHAWYWLTPAARQVLYPEVGPGDNGSVTMSGVAAGDARLNCFVGGIGAVSSSPGYRYNYGQAQELALPDCTSVGLDVTQLPRCGNTNRICIFSHDIVTDSRFGMIPVLNSWPNGQSQPRRLVRFWATFVYRLYTNNGGTALQGVDAWVFEPSLIETESGTADLMFGFQTDPVIRLIN
jgi:hypothetical protein